MTSQGRKTCPGRCDRQHSGESIATAHSKAWWSHICKLRESCLWSAKSSPSHCSSGLSCKNHHREEKSMAESFQINRLHWNISTNTKNDEVYHLGRKRSWRKSSSFSSWPHDQGRREVEDHRKMFYARRVQRWLSLTGSIRGIARWYHIGSQLIHAPPHLPSSLENLHGAHLSQRTRKISLNFNSIWTTKRWFMLIFKGQIAEWR